MTDLDARMNDGTTPLILAARLAVEGMVAELINCQADVNAVDDHGMDEDLAQSAEHVSKQENCYTPLRTFSDLKLESPLLFSHHTPFLQYAGLRELRH